MSTLLKVTKRGFIRLAGKGLLLSLMHPSLSMAQSYETIQAQLNQIDEELLEAGLFFRERQDIELEYYRARPWAKRPKPSRRAISPAAIDLIVKFEVSSRARYQAKFRRPIWPRGNSGVTFGIGYDAGYAKPKWLQDDWTGIIPQADIEHLQTACQQRGRDAQRILRNYRNIDIDWSDAYSQFHSRTLPLYVAETLAALPGANSLSDDSLGALVSLVYNRGASFNKRGNRYREMRRIRGHLIRGTVDQIPDELRSMTRIWRHNRDLRGVVLRREIEADLFEIGLRS
ncbi:hypothetical protein [Sinorhizobium meliloti]|uniref:hypothetical protein n=1 Tax=Rhizobium meliloti TaxID=382 RepID=UPI000FDB4270|nr:hypothetical protein [Sinorhizobium meliloti]RVO48166.1 hypothetical protein CN092_31665 [Sinorhizobium meliloti]